jgi:thymidylate kinase
MASDAGSFFESFFRELGKRGIPFAILHGYEHLPEQMPSDVDFVVRCEDLPRLLPLQREVAHRQGWVLASVVQAKLFAQYSVLFDPEDPRRFIQLDACGHYVERGCLVLHDTQLLQGCRPYRFFNVPAPASEFAYLLAKALLKSKPLEPCLPRLRELWKVDSAGAEDLFRKLIGESVGGLEQWFARAAMNWEQELRPRIRARNRFGLVNRVRECVRAIRRILHPAGLHIVILGPDGVGKSTLISQLGLACFRQVAQFHFRPGVLGMRASATVSQPHAQPPRSTVSSLAKIFYYFADHWTGYMLRTFPAKVRRELVIFDRSFEDVMVDPRRYRLAGSSSLARLLKQLLPAPDLTFVLDAEPELVHARKPELEIEELRRQREVLRRLAAATPRCLVIPAKDSPDQVARTVQKAIIQFLAQREKQRHGD